MKQYVIFHTMTRQGKQSLLLEVSKIYNGYESPYLGKKSFYIKKPIVYSNDSHFKIEKMQEMYVLKYDDGLSRMWVPAIDLKLGDVLFEADSDEDAKLYFYAREKL